MDAPEGSNLGSISAVIRGVRRRNAFTADLKTQLYVLQRAPDEEKDYPTNVLC